MSVSDTGLGGLVTSWKSRLFCAFVKQEIDVVEDILEDDSIRHENITIKYAEDCMSCVGNLEYAINPGQHNIDLVLHELKPMIDAGRCSCHGVGPAEGEGMGIIQSVSLLHLACLYGPVTMVERLLGEGYEAGEASLAAGFTPLHYLAQSDIMTSDDVHKIATMILSKEIDVNAQDKRRNLPLHLAIDNDMSSLALLLLENNSYIDTENDLGETPLLLAAKMNLADVLVKLSELGANPNIRDKNEMLALNVAIHKNSDRMISAILNCTHGVDTNLVGVARHGYRPVSPLVYATCRENERAVDLLLKKGAYVDCVDMDDSQPLLVAAYANNVEIAQLLIDHQADVNLAPRQGYSPLHHAAWEGHTNMCRLLLASGAQNDTQTRDKNTPLALACHGDFVDTIALLLNYPCDVNNQDKDSDAPLHYTTYNGNHDASYMLLEKGARPDIENNLQVTPLWNAVHANMLSLVELLIQCNVRLSVPSKGIDQHAETDHPTLIYDKPYTPLYVACSRGDMRIAERLVLAGVAFCEEKWFWEGDFPAELRDNAQLLHWLTHQATHPQSLLRLTRSTIRKRLGIHPLNQVQTLEIPKELQNFLLIRSFAVDL